LYLPKFFSCQSHFDVYADSERVQFMIRSTVVVHVWVCWLLDA